MKPIVSFVAYWIVSERNIFQLDFRVLPMNLLELDMEFDEEVSVLLHLGKFLRKVMP